MIFREDDPKAKQYPHMALYTDFLKPMERPLLGREKEMRQLMAAMARPELSNVILLAEAGTGKANSVDTILPVADERGYIRLGDVKVGDKVFNEDGYPVDVIGVFPQGMLHAYEVIFADGTSVVCNDEHLWAARTCKQHHDDKPYGVHTLRDMMDYGIVRSKKRSGRRDMNIKSWYVPCNKAVKRPDVDLPVAPYVMGALIGDGCLTGKKAFEFSSDDEPVVAKVAEGLGAVGYEKSSYNYSWHFVAPDGSEGRSDKIYMSCRDVAAKLSNDDAAFGKKSIDRRIPEMYMLGSESQRMELLRGLMDTDGTVRGSDGRVNASFSTNSSDLAKDVQKLANSLGYRTTLRQEKRNKKRKNAEYSVYFIVEDEETMNLFSLSRHIKWIEKHMRHNKKFHKIYDDMAIAEVRDLHRDEEMLCIYVDSPAHLFQITENHIVTHNTALVQGTMAKDTDRAYLEVNLPKMIADQKNENEIANKLKSLFREVENFHNDEGKEIVLFIDEFHQIVQLSSAAVEVLKPLLADSGTRGIRVIAATTYIEYQANIAANLPLVERLQRINLPQPSKDVVVSILKNYAERYGVGDQFVGNNMLEMIYEYTNRYIPANAQPRKSILMLDSMIGWHRVDHCPIDMRLLSDVIYETEGINIAFRVDATSIKSQLDKVVIAQQFASSAIESRLQICCADLNNKNKPMSSFLFTGSTGTGKTEMSKQLANILFQDERALVRMDMTEYALPESLERFRLELTQAVWTRPYCIILLDEIEKACAPVTRILLQVLDDGRLLDRNNREVTFKNAYIIVTTNAGSEIYKNISQYGVDDTGSGKALEKYESLIRDSIKGTTGGGKFPPELLGRIDCLVPFQPLSEKTMATICLMKLNKLRDDIMKKHRIKVEYEKRVIPYIVQDKMTTDSDAGGARGVVSRIEREVTTELSRYINAHPEMRTGGRTVYVCVDGELVVENKNRLATDAHIVIKDTPPQHKD